MTVSFKYKDWHFEWDSEKEAKNIRKHGVSFKRAAILFRDGEYVIDPDFKHSTVESRWVNLVLDQDHFLAVCVTWRQTKTGKTSYRIISALRISPQNVSKYRKRLRDPREGITK